VVHVDILLLLQMVYSFYDLAVELSWVGRSELALTHCSEAGGQAHRPSGRLPRCSVLASTHRLQRRHSFFVRNCRVSRFTSSHRYATARYV